MSKGKLKCIGTSQHLKNRYGKGYVVGIKAAFDKYDQIIQDFRDSFGADNVTIESTGLSLIAEIPNNQIKLAKIFQIVQKIKNIDDYTISQSSLEQVFMKFAREDEEEDLVVKLDPI